MHSIKLTNTILEVLLLLLKEGCELQNACSENLQLAEILCIEIGA